MHKPKDVGLARKISLYIRPENKNSDFIIDCLNNILRVVPWGHNGK